MKGLNKELLQITPNHPYICIFIVDWCHRLIRRFLDQISNRQLTGDLSHTSVRRNACSYQYYWCSESNISLILSNLPLVLLYRFLEYLSPYPSLDSLPKPWNHQGTAMSWERISSLSDSTSPSSLDSFQDCSSLPVSPCRDSDLLSWMASFTSPSQVWFLHLARANPIQSSLPR